VRNDPKILLRGLAKLVAVGVAAGLAGALIGIGLAKLSGDDNSGAAALPAGTATTSGTAARTTSTVPAEIETETTAAPTTQTTTTARRSFLVPRVQVLSARLIPAEGEDGVTVRVKVTNRASRPLKMTGPVLISGEDEIPLDDVDAAARPLLRTLAPDESATGTLRFSTSPAMTQRLTDNPGARLRIATRTITIKLTSAAP